MSTSPWGHQPDEQDPQAAAHQAPPPPAYPPYAAYGSSPGAPYGYTPVPSTNGMAIASLVVSILSLTTCVGATGFLGAILGHVSKGQIRRSNEQGGGMATAGIIIGWAGFALFLVGVTLFVVLAITAENTIGDYCYTDSNGDVVCN